MGKQMGNIAFGRPDRFGPVMRLDLDFVDPPILRSMDPYEPTIGPETAGAELKNLAADVRQRPPFDPEYTEAWPLE
jgi:hypothetical protein